MKPDNKTGGIWIYALGLIPVVWLALLIAPAFRRAFRSCGIFSFRNQHPLCNPLVRGQRKSCPHFIAAYGMGIGIYLSTRRNYRRGEEHGSAKWGDARA